MRYAITIFLMLAMPAAFVTAGESSAPIAEKEIDRAIVSSGGTSGDNGIYRLSGTTSQTAVGTGTTGSARDDYHVRHGFWVRQWCCEGHGMGNVDCQGIVDIGDVTAMIQSLVITLEPYCCEEEADVDYSGIVDIGDLTILIVSLFISLLPLEACP